MLNNDQLLNSTYLSKIPLNKAEEKKKQINTQGNTTLVNKTTVQLGRQIMKVKAR